MFTYFNVGYVYVIFHKYGEDSNGHAQLCILSKPFHASVLFCLCPPLVLLQQVKINKTITVLFILAL